jgi:serine/threonine protein kinase
MEKQFEIIEKIGQGAFSIVYKAKKHPKFEDTDPGKLYALKYVNVDPSNSKLALQESIFLKKCISCVNIIDCYDAFLSDDYKQLVMVNELCVCSLAEIMFLDDFLKDEQYLITSFVQCLNGLSFIHKK